MAPGTGRGLPVHATVLVAALFTMLVWTPAPANAARKAFLEDMRTEPSKPAGVEILGYMDYEYLAIMGDIETKMPLPGAYGGYGYGYGYYGYYGESYGWYGSYGGELVSGMESVAEPFFVAAITEVHPGDLLPGSRRGAMEVVGPFTNLGELHPAPDAVLGSFVMKERDDLLLSGPIGYGYYGSYSGAAYGMYYGYGQYGYGGYDGQVYPDYEEWYNTLVDARDILHGAALDAAYDDLDNSIANGVLDRIYKP